MDYPLAGCAAKLRRVETQIADLKRRTRAYGPKSHTIARKNDRRHGTITFRVKDIKQPPPEFGVLAGEIIHNLRSPLDYLIWQMVIRSGNKPTREHSFPISDRASRFRFESSNLSCLTNAERAFIESHQPYKGGNRKDHALWLLKELSNIDKHRLLHVCTAVSVGGGICGGVPDEGINWQMVDARFGPLKEGAKAYVVESPTGTRPEDLNVSANIACDIHFGKDSGPAAGTSVYYTLQYIFSYLHENVFVKPGLLDGFDWDFTPAPPITLDALLNQGSTRDAE